MRRFLLLLSISGIPKIENVKNTKKKVKKNGLNTKHSKKNNNKKIKNKYKMCRGGGGGGDLLYLLCLIFNTLPQLEQSSLHPTTVLRHRLQLQTTCYTHLRLLHLHISSKGKQKQQQARSPPPPPSHKGLRPFNPLHTVILQFANKPPFAYAKGLFAKMTSLQNGEEVLQSKCWSAMKALLIATSTLFTELENPSHCVVRMFPISQIVRFVGKKSLKSAIIVLNG